VALHRKPEKQTSVNGKHLTETPDTSSIGNVASDSKTLEKLTQQLSIIILHLSSNVKFILLKLTELLRFFINGSGFGDIAETYIRAYFTRPRSSIYPIRNICTGGRLDCESKDKRQRQVPHTLWIVLTSTLALYVNAHPPSPSKPLGTPQWPACVGSQNIVIGCQLSLLPFSLLAPLFVTPSGLGVGNALCSELGGWAPCAKNLTGEYPNQANKNPHRHFLADEGLHYRLVWQS